MKNTFPKPKFAPLVSVIIPAYNARKWIDETLQSVRQQTWRDYEVVVVDDGGEDNLQHYLEITYPNQLKVIRQENRGLSSARNTGFASASGRFICFLDADDLILPEKLETQVNILETYPHVGVVFSDYEMFSDGAPQFVDHQKPILWQEEDFWTILLRYNPIVVHAALVRRELIDRYGGFDEEMVSCADWDFWMRLVLHGVVFAFEKRKSALYRQRSDSLSRNRLTKAEADLQVMNKAYELASRLGHPSKEEIPKHISYRLFRLAQVYLLEDKRGKALHCLVNSILVDPSLRWKRRYGLLMAGLLLPLHTVQSIILSWSSSKWIAVDKRFK